MPITYTYQWQRTPDNGTTVTDIAGASGTFTNSPPFTQDESYQAVSADLGDKVRLKVTDGTTIWYSPWSDVVTDTPAPPASSIYWGAYMEGVNTYGSGYGNAPWDSNTWNKFEADAGKTVSICHFGQPMWQFNQGPHDLCWARGAIPMVDYGTSTVSLTDVINGVYDSAITAWATSYKNWGKPSFIRLWWEMNQYGSHWFNWAVPYYYTAAQYVSASQHVINLCNGVGATNMTWVWCPNFIGTDSSRVSQIEDCYWGDGYADWTAFDGYNSYSPSQNFDSLYQLTYDTILGVAPSKPMMIGEFSSRDDIFSSGTKATWITDALTNKIPSASYDAIKAIVWFNWKIFENSVTKDWQIESSTSAQNAFAAAIASSYYNSKFVSTPPFGKVPIPT